MRTDFGNFINGEWVDASSGETFESLNPADRTEVLGTFARGGPADIDRAVQAAVAAYPDWMKTPAPTRADYVLRVALLLEERKEELSEVMTREMGKTLKE
ncbi:MAG: aldehyde dehydrogenase family protein, partial [Actinomycetota bacterium]|nr:aldehyde dehydrogenase family protein [Actinomycetota bacterium]